MVQKKWFKIIISIAALLNEKTHTKPKYSVFFESRKEQQEHSYQKLSSHELFKEQRYFSI